MVALVTKPTQTTVEKILEIATPYCADGKPSLEKNAPISATLNLPNLTVPLEELLSVIHEKLRGRYAQNVNLVCGHIELNMAALKKLDEPMSFDRSTAAVGNVSRTPISTVVLPRARG